MNKIETLPRYIEYKGRYYALRMHITAWERICLCYRSYDDEGKYIFSQVIEPDSTPYYGPNPTPEDIIDVLNFDEAVNVLEKRIKDAIEANLIKV